VKVDYGALSRTASGLSAAGSEVGGEVAVPSQLLSGAPGPDAAHSEASFARGMMLVNTAMVLRAQSRSCAEMVTLFQLLDSQIASQVGSW
jgi:hypothetical protein